MNILIPMAGLGSRLKGLYDKEKPLIKVKDKELILHSLETLNIDGRFIFITRNYEDIEQNNELSSLLKTFQKESIEIKLDKPTNGAAETSFYAKDFINDNSELIITNCDQYLSWNSYDFLNNVREDQIDGAVVCFKSKDKKNSFAKIENGFVTKIVEKNPISDSALVGIHYWKRGKDFVDSASKLISNFQILGSPECYISETYNFLIQDRSMKILPFFINPNQYISLGTKEDIDIFLGKAGEFSKDSRGTIICDIDGTILKHKHKYSLVHSSEPEILPGVKEKFDFWDSNGYRIILISARKESSRELTEIQLANIGLPYDQLILGVNNGPRYLVNDKLNYDDPDRAFAINLITDSGFENLDWKSFGL